MKYKSTCMALALTGILLALPALAGQQEPDASSTASTAADPAPVQLSRMQIPATDIDGMRLAELSGLAWDQDEQLLYAVSDQGIVFHFRLERDGTALQAVEPVYAAALTDPDDKASAHKKFNAEGLALLHADNGKTGDSVLVVALEDKHHPGILRVSPDGKVLGTTAVPAPLDDPDNYDKAKRGLESMALHPQFGLLTAPESPLDKSATLHTLYAEGRHWSFPRYTEKDNRLKGLAVLADGSLLVLERSELGTDKARTASVRLVDLQDCAADDVCTTTNLAVLPAGPDNFEGIAQLGADQILLVSDQGGKDSQATVFVLITFTRG